MAFASHPDANPALRPPQALTRALARYPLCAPLLGALAACGFRPLALWPLALLGVAGLFALVARAQSWRQATLIGWLWGVGHFTLGNNWIATAFTYQAKMPMWLGWVSVVLLALYLAVYPALAALGGWLFRREPAAMALAFAGCWIIAEALRGWVFTGFPWNPLGVALLGDFAHPGLAGLARWTGAYGLSGLTALLAGVIALGAARLVQRRDAAAWLLLAGPLALVLAAMHWPAPRDTAAGTIRYTLVQPNIPQAQLDDPLWFNAQFVKTAELSLPLAGDSKRLVLWPESGAPDYLRDGYPAWAYRETTYAGDPALARTRLARVIGRQAVLLTGSVDLEISGDHVSGARNVVTAVDGQGRIAAGYTKAHLVPYGEYLPLRWLLQPLGLARLLPGDMDFTPGPGPRRLDLGPLGKAGIQICYEIIFSGAVVDAAHRPDYIFNPSNDGWFGDWGPPQHLAQARLRAIEEGLPVLRSTTNGVSAVVNADGVVLRAAPRGVAARFDGLIPPPHPATLFARMGLMLSLYWSVALLGASVLVLRRRRG
jgi:apolipoprotein N-acyltransferase